MKIGVPKEIKAGEFRAGLTPEATRHFTAAGHEVYVETGLGAGLRVEDFLYKESGAIVLSNATDIFATADMIIKVKEPQRSEWRKLRSKQILFGYLHLAPDPALAQGLLQSGCTAIAYETVTDSSGGLPLLAPMSEVAGRLAIEAACYSLRRNTGGRGILIGGVPGVPPARIVVLGGGVVGTQAARMAVGLNADVTIIDLSLQRLRELDETFGGRIRTRFSTSDAIEEEVFAADVVIGAALVYGARTPKLVTRAMLGHMKPAAVLVDVAIDQGGCFETSHPTTHENPTYEVDGIIHYCVANMPGAVPWTSSHALCHATVPFGLELASGLRAATERDKNLHNGVNIHDGHVTNRAVAESLSLPFVSLDSCLG